MQLTKYQEDIRLCQALKILDKELKDKNVEPFTLNVIGGFALLLQRVRKNPEAFTDIDYVDEILPSEVRDIVNKVGIQYNLGADWINNDVVLAGTGLKDLEYATGKLHFKKTLKLDIITVNVLSKLDLLKLKVIAIDTALSSVEFGGEFTRAKDFSDIMLLLNDLHLSTKDLREFGEFVLNDNTFKIIDGYSELSCEDKETTILRLIEDVVDLPDDSFIYNEASIFNTDNAYDALVTLSENTFDDYALDNDMF